MGLCFCAPMLHRAEQTRIQPCQPCQHPGVEPVIFSTALPDQPHVPRMRHDHFMSQLGQLPSDPREWAPVSIATRLRGILPNTCWIAGFVVGSFCSTLTS